MSIIAIYSDYVCPFCMLAEHKLKKAIGDRNIKIEWRPFELRPDPVPTLRPEDPYLPAIWRKAVYPLAAQQGISIKLPSVSPQPRTDKAFELLQLAKDRGIEHIYSMRVFSAFFQENLDIGNIDVLVDLAIEVGLNGSDAREALMDGRFKSRHQKALLEAREEMNIEVVPTIVIGKRVFRGTPNDYELAMAITDLGSEINPADASST